MTRRIRDGIKVGDTFNAYTKKGPHSKRLDGLEGAGQLSFGCPEIATYVNECYIVARGGVYKRTLFAFEKLPNK